MVMPVSSSMTAQAWMHVVKMVHALMETIRAPVSVMMAIKVTTVSLLITVLE